MDAIDRAKPWRWSRLEIGGDAGPGLVPGRGDRSTIASSVFVSTRRDVHRQRLDRGERV